MFSIAVLPHSPGVVYYHLLLRRETRVPGVAPFSFRIGIWDLFVHRGQKSYTPMAFGKLRTTPGVTCLIMIHDPGMRLGPESNLRNANVALSTLGVKGHRARQCGHKTGNHLRFGHCSHNESV